MFHQLFKANPANKYRVAILCKQNTFDQARMQQNYVNPIVNAGIPQEECIAFTLKYDDAKKVKAATVKEYSEQLLQALKKLDTQYLYVTDGNYFKYLAGQKKTDVHLGYVLPCVVPGYEHMNVVYGINYQQLVFAPDKKVHLTQGLTALTDHINGAYEAPGTGIIHSESYPDDLQSIKNALFELHKFPFLSCDIESFGLGLEEGGIGTIQFAWTKHDFIAFKVDLQELLVPDNGEYSRRVDNPERRALVREFLETYKGELRYHSAVFDCKHLVYNLWMNDPLDYKGTLTGLDIITRNMHCTKVISYLATNSCAGNHLSLKYQSQEYAGNYAVEEIKDIRRIPVKELLRYNGVDGLATNYVYDKNYPIMVKDQQLDLYNGLMRDSLRLIINIELVGLPMCPIKVVETRDKLLALQKGYLKQIMDHPLTHQLNHKLQVKEVNATNAKLKNKQHPLEKFASTVFNPGSPLQLQVLLYELMELPVIARTDTKQPSTAGDVIEALMKHPKAQPYLKLIQAIIDWAAVSTIVSNFLPAFENGQLKADGMRYLHGAFNLGGTKSGRLSSSDPNMQNIPAGSAYGKLIKELFMGPAGWLFAGADFNSLEDYISALTTKDPNKLKVYEEGFDGHALRAAYYFKDDLEGEGIFIDLANPKSVNQLKKNDHPKRQESKTPTFLLTYGGTHHGMQRQLGWTKEKAMKIEANYHDLYKVSDQYIADRIQQASKDGYVTVAFGLRLRTPMLAKTILGTRSTPFEAAAEGRTAGNAMGQSYGLLNNRAAAAFMKRVHASPFRYDIKPVALIHDAIYILIRNNPAVVEFANRVLIEEMSWQELPELQHPTVKIGAALDIFYPNWAKPVTLPVNATIQQIKDACREHKEKLAA